MRLEDHEVEALAKTPFPIRIRTTGIAVATTTLCKYADLYDNGSVH